MFFSWVFLVFYCDFHPTLLVLLVLLGYTLNRIQAPTIVVHLLPSSPQIHLLIYYFFHHRKYPIWKIKTHPSIIITSVNLFQYQSLG